MSQNATRLLKGIPLRYVMQGRHGHQFLAIKTDQRGIYEILNLHNMGHHADVTTSAFKNLCARGRRQHSLYVHTPLM